MVKKALPVGRDSFNEIRNDGYYYVDKTGLVRDLLQPGGMVMGGF
ncbi:MAG: AAA family ATPase [Lachnospiraceae bacterium]|nr:AAA family ATPase [Lachnospiraceae bacterium]